jgi:hypothetical protein
MEERPGGIVARALVDTGAKVTRAAEHAFQVGCREAPQIDPHALGAPLPGLKRLETRT